MLMLAMVLGIASFALMFAFLNSRGDGGNSGVQSAVNGKGAEQVVVASRDIAVGEVLKEEDLKTKSLPAPALLPGRYTKLSDLVGQITAAPIQADDQLTSFKVTSTTDQNTIAFKVDPQHRAMSLMIPHEAWIVGGLPQPGDRVDIIGITTLERVDPLTQELKIDVVSGVIAKDIKVLAVSQTVIKSVKTTGDKTGKGAAATATAAATGTPAAGATPAADAGAAEGRAFDTGDTFQTALSITFNFTIEEAAKVSIIDAMKDDVAQYRVLVRPVGETGAAGVIEGNLTWTLEDVFEKKKK